MHPASNPASEVVAAAVLAAGAAAADTIAGLRAEVALLQAESAHLRALEAARLQAWAADLRAKVRLGHFIRMVFPREFPRALVRFT